MGTGNDKNGSRAGGQTLIYACSGASDVGELADRSARRLAADGIGRMTCLAGVGSKANGFIAMAAEASRLLVIDGCPQECAKKTIEAAGFQEAIHMRLDSLGSEKGLPLRPGPASTASRHWERKRWRTRSPVAGRRFERPGVEKQEAISINF